VALTGTAAEPFMFNRSLAGTASITAQQIVDRIRTKVDFMTKRDIVIFRIHDHMQRQRPDFTLSGTAREVDLDPMTETAPILTGS
jgi:hypothetical protein